ncbi:hypothetical protein B0T26DRAFT_710877 [Lasiosphaeria miniovina]|uniref:Mitochondrial chaperone BCS1-like ATPase lid domain-containing protein n=1 Tax=Lasiosphaeria miniovina TaxID=1954250 RepID=A0AA40AL65_9PEZI|nr:uncharacterized protein B0T26DRAFT_710877 [Lasiosphaeria miniovina]KAK0717795.1 hypothetical protein B0T26DRAFT_710877 [Lasiosphaeria miniovina]
MTRLIRLQQLQWQLQENSVYVEKNSEDTNWPNSKARRTSADAKRRTGARIDKNVQFNNATPKQAMQCFQRIYGDENDESKELAKEFGGKIPDGAFSIADIQGFLTENKNDLAQAVEKTDAWVYSWQKEVSAEGGLGRRRSRQKGGFQELPILVTMCYSRICDNSKLAQKLGIW